SGAIFVLGEMLILPTIDSTISQLSKAGLIGLFFGLANVLSGLGEAAGNLVGGRLLELGTEISYLSWLIYALSGVVIGLIVLVLIKWKPMQHSLKQAAQQKNKPQKAPRVNPGPSNHLDRKSTRLNSSHVSISYAVFCLKKKNNKELVHAIRCRREARQG